MVTKDQFDAARAETLAAACCEGDEATAAQLLSTAQRQALRGYPYLRRPKLPQELGVWGGYACAYFQPSAFGRRVLAALDDAGARTVG